MGLPRSRTMNGRFGSLGGCLAGTEFIYAFCCCWVYVSDVWWVTIVSIKEKHTHVMKKDPTQKKDTQKKQPTKSGWKHKTAYNAIPNKRYVAQQKVNQ